MNNNNYFDMKIALVHDMLSEFGGAERVLLAISELWPDAPIYTAFYRKGSPAWERFKDKDVRVSWAHYIPGFATRLHSPLRFLASSIWNSFDFSEFDVIIGSASWYITKGFRKGQETISSKQEHRRPIEICYCHTPPRWLYGYPTSIEWQKYALVRTYANIVGFFMRQYDFTAAQKVDYFIANSQETQRRIQKFYRRDSTVIYPPIESQKSPIRQAQGKKVKSQKSYFLVVSRLAQPKNVDMAIGAANTLKFPLKIAGTGPDEARLRGMAGKTVEFLGHVSDGRLAPLYGGAKAFLALATDEDFGMTPVEAMAHGTPVIAFSGGGYKESVVDGITGVLFDNDLISAIRQFERMSFSAKACIAQAKKFSKARFQKKLIQFVESKRIRQE